MGSSESTEATEPRAIPEMVDLNAKMKEWAFPVYEGISGEYDYKDIEMEVLWDRVRFETQDVNYLEKEGPKVTQTMMLLHSEFENNTNETQEHQFTTTRATESSTTTVLTKGFTRGVSTGINIPVPQEVSDVTSGLGSEVVVESDEKSTVKHSVSWTANSKIRVPPMSRTVAELKIKQDRFLCRFDAVVTFKGRVKVRFLHARTGQFLTTVENDISTIVEDLFKRNNLMINNPDVEGSVMKKGKKIFWPVSGSLVFKYGVSQNVEVSHVKKNHKSGHS